MQSDKSPNIDPLTGLFNSAYGMEALRDVVREASDLKNIDIWSGFKTPLGDVF